MTSAGRSQPQTAFTIFWCLPGNNRIYCRGRLRKAGGLSLLYRTRADPRSILPPLAPMALHPQPKYDAPYLPVYSRSPPQSPRSVGDTMKRFARVAPQPGSAIRRYFVVLLVGTACMFGVATLFLPEKLSTAFPSSVSDFASCSESSLVAPNDIPLDHAYPLPLDATLEQRLAAWRNSPGIDWEPPDFVRWNLETCGDVIPNHNRDLISKSSLLWGSLNSTALIGLRERMAAHLEQKRDEGVFEAHGPRGLVGKGRGIVFTAGNSDTLSRVVVTLKLIRQHYKSTLPAAIYHFPSERPPEDSPLRAELAGLGAVLVEATGRDKDLNRRKNYHLKAQSIVESKWAEVIYLDSDNFPVLDPSLLFEQKNYKRLGAMFWPDYWKTSANNPMWQILGIQCRDEWEQEAGQIVIDKRKHLDALLLSMYMLEDWPFWFNFSDGDKDVFRFAFLALRKRWALPGRYVGAAAFPGPTASGPFCSHTMQQYDSDGRPAFVHYNLMKQIPSGVFQGFSWRKTKQLVAFPKAHNTPVSNPVSTRQSAVPYPDPVMHDADDVEADMLANADDDGWGIQPATEEVRRRAAVERAIRPYFHGGVISALCIDMDWDREPNLDKVGVPNELGIDWSHDPLEIVQWSADSRLKDLESNVYDLGFVPVGHGF
ncbi:glycosyltransferase family 71 protein [Botryobasidium botryosum FD-172 SS1]|uniref:Glycosyltransferase family 71 protein n=1 Tax=Botryobasidium botryosum (strain FD-172 SS1) TaxID=930990 RepID=A0A067NAD8_BOTB1|nr:glycosyltransferase family 71 protein [Botryobasidium botryosum FD-172 SS1]